MTDRKLNIAVIGLGYVGLPLAIEFSKKDNVIGYDLNKLRVSELNKQYDRTNELSKEELLEAKYLKVTSSEEAIKSSNIYIVTVPTPVDKNNRPILTPLIKASETVGAVLKKGDIVIKINDYSIDDMMSYMETLSKFNKGDKAEVSVLRDTKIVILNIEF